MIKSISFRVKKDLSSSGKEATLERETVEFERYFFF